VKRGKKPQDVADVGLAPVYTYLGVAYARLGMWDQAIAAYKYARHLDPNDQGGEIYFKIGLAYLYRGNTDDAICSLIQCVIMAPGRNDAWRILADLLSRQNSDGQQAIIVGPDGAAHLNMQARAVRENLCTAYRDWVRVFRRCKRDEMAKAARDAAVNTYGYPKSLFDPLLIENVVPPVPPEPMFYNPKLPRPAPDLPGFRASAS
jgi:tetratricopeptide (TPR) repeat protein